MKNTAFLFLSNYLCHVPSRHNIIMTLTLKTNKWASRLIIILQLTVWSTVSVVLLQKGISSLQKRILETSNNVIKVDLSNGSGIKTTILSMKHIENKDDFVVVPGKKQLLIEEQQSTRLLPQFLEIAKHSIKPKDYREQEYENLNKTYFVSPIMKMDQTDKHVFDINKYQSNNIKENEKTLNLQMKDRFKEINQRIDNLQRKNVSNKIFRITRNRERIADSRILKDAGMQTNSVIFEKSEKLGKTVIQPISTMMPVSQKEKNHDATYSMTNKTIIHKPSNMQILSGDTLMDTPWSKNKIHFSGISNGGTAVAITMVAIGSIMLVLGPIVLILRTIDKKRQMKKFTKLSITISEDLPPSYEQAILIDKAPRYSTLFLNDQVNEYSSLS